MVKLGGWQRLWVFIAGLYLLAVVFYAVSSAPVPEAVPHRTEFYERMGQEAISVLTAALDTQDIIRVKALNGHEIPFAAGTPKEKMESFLRQYNEALQEQASQERLRFFGRTFLWWLLPVAVFYALGAAVGWVYKGFKSS